MSDIGRLYLEYHAETKKSGMEFLKEHPEYRDYFKVKKNHIEPYVEKYIDFMINQQNEISNRMRTNLLNLQEDLMADYMQDGTSAKHFTEDHFGSLTGQNKLDFLEDLRRNLITFLCSDQFSDTLRWKNLFRLQLISSIPNDKHSDWLNSAKNN